MKKVFGFLALSAFAVAFSSGAAAAAKTPKTILAIFAHPDDETGPGPALTMHAKTGKVHIAYVTDGRYGVREGLGVAINSDELVALRKEEGRCAAAARGLEAPVFFGFPDQIVGDATVIEQIQRLSAATARIVEEIERVSPDIVVTFGPGGYTGHPDHRLVGALVQQAMLSREWGDMRLLTFAPANSQVEIMDRAFPLIGQSDASLNVAVHFGDDVLAVEEKAFRCHDSQFSPEQMDEILGALARDTTNTRWFREVPLKQKVRKGF
ncbi:MAG: PIG-L family deacetylase [Amphiplicatus sp.]